MVFNSIAFAIYFVVVISLYFAMPFRYRHVFLLAASCYFYMAFIPIYILILVFTITVDYFVGICLESAEGNKRKLLLMASIFANVGVLAVFKYQNFIISNTSSLVHLFGGDRNLSLLSIVLPIGLSFHTFQALSYIIEVYRGHQKAERNFILYALYVMFFPQLVAGPIERPQNLLPQFHLKHDFRYSEAVDGLRLILWGLFKKVVIADRLALYVDAVYGNPNIHNGTTFIVATIFFAFQIYCDFSGYSDIAIGSAKIMGIRLMDNFRRPYLSKSIAEFWRRWHISLSSWFRDYLYISLGGNRVPIPRWYLNLLIVFLVSGLWHGAKWTFVIWGGLNGIYLVMGILTRDLRENIVKTFRLTRFSVLLNVCGTAFTFAIVCFTWVFFRADNVSDAFLIIKKMAFPSGALFVGQLSILAYSIFGILFLMLIELNQEYSFIKISIFGNRRWYVRQLAYNAMAVLILLVGVFDSGQFIYFQF